MIIKALVLYKKKEEKKAWRLEVFSEQTSMCLFCVTRLIYSIAKTKTNENLQAVECICAVILAQPEPQLAPWEICRAMRGWRRRRVLLLRLHRNTH